MAEREDLLTRIAASLDKLGAPEEVVPERIRPVSIQTKDRKDLSDLEKEMQKTLDALKGDERLPGILSRVATIHLRESSYPRAIMLYEVSLGLDSNQTGSWIHMGLAYLMAGEAKDAITCLETALSIDSEDVRALVFIALAHLELGANEECQKNLEKALKIQPNLDRAMLGKGVFFSKTGN